jgi:hypothetical protein
VSHPFRRLQLSIPYNTQLRRLGSFVALLLFAAACSSIRRSRQPGGDQYLIVGSELQASSHNNLYDAVRQLRPSWFTKDMRGGSGPSDQRIMVYVNDRNVGSATELRSYPVAYPSRLRYMAPTEAQVRFGPANRMRPAIVIETDRP